MRFLVLFMGVLLSAFSAKAEDADQITFCNLLPDYNQPAGVEYQPGVGPNGPVVSADVDGGQGLRNFDTIQIPVVADLIKKFDPDVPWGTELKPDVALISIHNDGKVEYNGKDVSPQAHALCGKGKIDEQAGPKQ